MTTYDVIDLFAGAGGWDVALRELGLHAIGVENDRRAIETREANDFDTIGVDIRTIAAGSEDARCLVASPPCQTFSVAGKGAGRRALDDVLRLVQRIDETGGMLTASDVAGFDERTLLVVEPLLWAVQRERAGDPYDWIALEQVPGVLPVWDAVAEVLARRGYHGATFVLHAEQYGVPQTRRRAFLIANRHGVVLAPQPLHRRYRHGDTQHDNAPDFELLAPWVSMSDALGWSEGTVAQSTYSTHSDYSKRGERTGAQPSATITTHANRTIVWHEQDVYGKPRLRDQSGHVPDLSWPFNRPSTTVAGRGLVVHPGEISNRFNTSTKTRNDGVRLSIAEAAALQTFPRDFTWDESTRTATYNQIGNAVPPLLARAVLRAASVVATCFDCGNDMATVGLYCTDCREALDAQGVLL